MRRRSVGNNKKPSTSSSSTTSQAEALSLGLRGLDEADVLRGDGHEKCALDLYQSAIEVLIRLLGDNTTSTLMGDHKTAVEERVRLALSDAEYLKEKLRRGGQKQSTAETSSESPIRKTCFTRITHYLAGVRTAAAPKKASPQIIKTQTQPPKQRRSTMPSRPSQPPPPQQTSPSNRSTSTTNTARTNHTAASHTKENQALVRSVLDDMHVPSARLQRTTWDDIAGLATAKQALQEAAILPLCRPDLFTGLRKPQNILLYGPPGTGKTLLVKAVAYESQCTLFTCTASAITSKWLGEGEKLCRTLFELAQEHAPTILFFDEMDAIASTRKSDGENEASRRLKTEIMQRMDGINPQSSRVLVIACTNCPWDVDSAILRRFSRRIFVPLPDKDARKALVQNLLAKAGNHSISSSARSDIVKKLKGFSGSDIQSIAAEASFGPLRSVGSLNDIKSVRAKDVRPISAQDFDNAIGQATKSVTREQLKRYDEWMTQQGA